MTFFSHFLKWLRPRKSGSTAVPVQPLTSQSRKPIRFLQKARRAKPMVQPIRLQKTARRSRPKKTKQPRKPKLRNCMRPKPWLTSRRLSSVQTKPNNVQKKQNSVQTKQNSVQTKLKNVQTKPKSVPMKQNNVQTKLKSVPMKQKQLWRKPKKKTPPKRRRIPKYKLG